MKNKNIKKIVTGLAGLGVAAALAGCGGGGGGAGTPGTKVYTQRERLSRPLVNEALATFANNRHEVNNVIPPTEDVNELKNDIFRFMKDAAGRDDAHANALAGLLTPDVMQIDLSKPAPASYLGIETGGFTGGTFGGRALQDDVVDISLGAIFGETLSALKVVPAADGKAILTLTTDNVGDGAKNYTPNAFPYMGAPK